MAKEPKPYARYYIVRGHQTLWRGDAAEAGSEFRELVITSNEFNSTQGTFQLFALEGTGTGIKDGKLAVAESEPKVLCDQDFQGLEAAAKKFGEVVKEAEAQGFKTVSVIDQLEFEDRLRRSKE